MANLFEQIVADYLTEKGYLTKLNVNYRKKDGRQTGSDIDVLAFHPITKAVIVGDCKSGNWGFSGDWLLGPSKEVPRNQGYFKAIFRREWADGLAQKICDECGARDFTYTIYCTHLDGGFDEFKKRTVAGNPIEVVTLTDIIRETVQRIKNKPNKSVEPTMLGRFVQLLLNAKINIEL
ncbi:MAG: hypothetical protein HY532_00850 [Chloroflexi bacterium]|nr:hypothetical protein [Chloroflexota bacterium]